MPPSRLAPLPLHTQLPPPSSGPAASALARSKIKLKMMLTLSVRSSLGMMLFMSAADTYKGQEVQERKGVLLVQVQLDSFESGLHFHPRGSRTQLKTEQQQERINSHLMLQQLQICYLLLCSSGEVLRKDTYSVLSVSWAGILRCRGTRLEGKHSDLTTAKKYTWQSSGSHQTPAWTSIENLYFLMMPSTAMEKGTTVLEPTTEPEIKFTAMQILISFRPVGIILKEDQDLPLPLI